MKKPCETCGEEFDRPKKLSVSQWENRRFCSKKCRRKTEYDAESIRQMYLEGFSSTEIGEKLKISPTHIRRILISIGQSIRSTGESNKIVMSRPDIKRKMIEASTGRVMSEESKSKLRALTGDKSANWNGGLTINSSGYIYFTSSSSNGIHKNKALHVVIAEWAFGRKIERGEHVHHIDGDKLNNKPSNLRILSASEHAKLHARERVEK